MISTEYPTPHGNVTKNRSKTLIQVEGQSKLLLPKLANHVAGIMNTVKHCIMYMYGGIN